MYTRILFQDHKGSNSKVQCMYSILKTIYEQVRYLDIFCCKTIAMFTNTYAENNSTNTCCYLDIFCYKTVVMFTSTYE